MLSIFKDFQNKISNQEPVQLGEYISFIKGRKPSDSRENLLPYLTIDGMNTNNYECVCSDKILLADEKDNGASSGTIYSGYNEIVGSTLAILDCIQTDILPLIEQRLIQMQEKIKELNTGSAIPHANKEFIKSITISLSNDEYQHNITNQLKYNNKYERNKTIYSKYENISNLVVVDLQNLEVWHLGKNKMQANKLFKLVLRGKKISTSYLYNENKSPTNNSYSILTNWDKKKQILIQTTNIQVIPFNKATKQHARNEGEGTKTLRYWRKTHKKFFIEELAVKGQSFSEETLIVCETFRVVRILK